MYAEVNVHISCDDRSLQPCVFGQQPRPVLFCNTLKGRQTLVERFEIRRMGLQPRSSAPPQGPWRSKLSFLPVIAGSRTCNISSLLCMSVSQLHCECHPSLCLRAEEYHLRGRSTLYICSAPNNFELISTCSLHGETPATNKCWILVSQSSVSNRT